MAKSLSTVGLTLAALGLGALATLGFAPFGWWPLTLLAYGALLWMVAPLRARAHFGLGFAFGLGHFVSGIYWVYISTVYYGSAPPALGVALVVLLSAFMALYGAAAFALARWLAPAGLGTASWPLTLSVLWIVGELLRGTLLEGFPWLATGYISIDTPLSDFAPVIGVHGLSGLLVLACGLVAAALRSGNGRDRVVATAAVMAIAIGGWLLPKPSAWTQPVGEPITAALIQGNIRQVDKWNPAKSAQIAETYRAATAAATADLVVWPEVALPYRYPQIRDGYLAAIGQAARQKDQAILLGTLFPSADGSQMINGVAGAGAAQGQYFKRHLVPFGEIFPLPDFLRPVLDVMDLQFPDLQTGNEGQPHFTVKGVAVSVSICFEDVFGDEIAREARGSGLLVNVTNDSWFHDSSAGPQHLQIARMRSIETGRPMLKVAQTGITAHIGADGQLIAVAPRDAFAVLETQAQPRAGMTPYMRWQDGPWWWSGGLVLLLLLSRRVIMRMG